VQPYACEHVSSYRERDVVQFNPSTAAVLSATSFIFDFFGGCNPGLGDDVVEGCLRTLSKVLLEEPARAIHFSKVCW